MISLPRFVLSFHISRFSLRGNSGMVNLPSRPSITNNYTEKLGFLQFPKLKQALLLETLAIPKSIELQLGLLNPTRSMGVHVHKGIEMVETVLEVADVAWKSMELRHRYQHKKKKDDHENGLTEEEDDEVESLRMENRRLRNILEENLKLLQRLSESPLSDDFPPDLHKRLEKAVDSAAFLAQLQSLHQASLDEPFNHFPFRKATGTDLNTVETLVNVGLKEPSLWVWVTHEETSPNVEELSEIDNEAYVVVNEELIVDGVANFMARCILSNPKSKLLTPEELQKTVSKALGGVNKLESMLKIWEVGKILFALSTWGLTLAGLYRHRAIAIPIVKGTARGVVATSNFVKGTARGVVATSNIVKGTARGVVATSNTIMKAL